MKNEELLDALTKAVCYKYSDDATRPGITTSLLRSGEYYCSIVRYNIGVSKKKVVCNAQGSTLSSALQSAAKKFLSLQKATPKNPVEELTDLVGSDK